MSKGYCHQCGRKASLNDAGECRKCEDRTGIDMMADRECTRLRVDGFSSRAQEVRVKDAERRAI